MARKGSKIRQKPETEQGRKKDVGKECSTPRGKCVAKRRIWERIIWRERRTDNAEIGRQ